MVKIVNKSANEITSEYMLRKKNRINKIVLSIFLFVAISALVMKLVDGVLIDFGFGVDQIMKDNYRLLPVSEQAH